MLQRAFYRRHSPVGVIKCAPAVFDRLQSGQVAVHAHAGGAAPCRARDRVTRYFFRRRTEMNAISADSRPAVPPGSGAAVQPQPPTYLPASSSSSRGSEPATTSSPSLSPSPSVSETVGLVPYVLTSSLPSAEYHGVLALGAEHVKTYKIKQNSCALSLTSPGRVPPGPGLPS